MPADKLEISWKIDSKSEIYDFVMWYEDYYRTSTKDPSGKDRFRKGNAKKFLKEYLEKHIKWRFSSEKNGEPLEGNVLEETADVFRNYQQSKRLPLELAARMKNLSPEDGKKLLDLWKKGDETA